MYKSLGAQPYTAHRSSWCHREQISGAAPRPSVRYMRVLWMSKLLKRSANEDNESAEPVCRNHWSLISSRSIFQTPPPLNDCRIFRSSRWTAQTSNLRVCLITTLPSLTYVLLVPTSVTRQPLTLCLRSVESLDARTPSQGPACWHSTSEDVRRRERPLSVWAGHMEPKC